MLPEELHVEQISRFHKVIKKLGEDIQKEADRNKKLDLSMQYYELTVLWGKIDELVEFSIKHKLDTMRLD
jgi:hypothetical protein